jgi:uncharacterized protein (TIGR02646 family)
VIRIKRPKKAPAVLQNRGHEATRTLCEARDVVPETYENWTFNSKIYGAKSVKASLCKAQHDKCAFCESKVSHIAYGDVEHFRPKAGYRQNPEDPLAQPGYYWLAFDWTNLLFCCQICNQRQKRSYFPLLDANERARSHNDDIKKEKPLLINPAEEDPERFIEFNEEYVRAIDGNARGEVTIDVLGLNRDVIAERRRDALAVLKNLIACRALLAKGLSTDHNHESRRQIVKIDGLLKHRVSDSGEYAAMVRALVRKSLLSLEARKPAG